MMRCAGRLFFPATQGHNVDAKEAGGWLVNAVRPGSLRLPLWYMTEVKSVTQRGVKIARMTQGMIQDLVCRPMFQGVTGGGQSMPPVIGDKQASAIRVENGDVLLMVANNGGRNYLARVTVKVQTATQKDLVPVDESPSVSWLDISFV